MTPSRSSLTLDFLRFLPSSHAPCTVISPCSIFSPLLSRSVSIALPRPSPSGEAGIQFRGRRPFLLPSLISCFPLQPLAPRHPSRHGHWPFTFAGVRVPPSPTPPLPHPSFVCTADRGFGPFSPFRGIYPVIVERQPTALTADMNSNVLAPSSGDSLTPGFPHHVIDNKSVSCFMVALVLSRVANSEKCYVTSCCLSSRTRLEFWPFSGPFGVQKINSLSGKYSPSIPFPIEPEVPGTQSTRLRPQFHTESLIGKPMA